MEAIEKDTGVNFKPIQRHTHACTHVVRTHTTLHTHTLQEENINLKKKNPVVVEIKGIAPVSSDTICELEWEASLDRWRVLPWPRCVKGFYHFTWILSLSLLCLTPLPINSSPLSLCALGLWTLKAFITMLFLEKVKEKAFPDDPPCILLPCK